MNLIDTLLSRRALIAVAGVGVALFIGAAIIAGIWGQHPSNDAADVIGSICWFGWMVAALVLVVLSVAALVRRSLGGGRRATA
ncbi:MAG: hypothetical protein AB7O78_07345 [Thermoleophilia bacterium]